MALYDDPAFLAGYRELRRTGLGLNDELEIPAMAALLPSTADGLRVADLGCGEGDLAVRLASAGASVVAVDASASMLSQAAPHPRIRYQQADLARLDLPESSLGQVERNPHLAVHRRRPPLLLISARLGRSVDRE
jgi:SAM-dependent methyltransferase